MNSKLTLGLCALAAMTAGGCAPVDAGMGEALKYDMAAQTIDPDPVYGEEGAKPGDNGERAAAATERYRKGEVKSVQVMSTKNSGGSGGGGSGPQ